MTHIQNPAQTSAPFVGGERVQPCGPLQGEVKRGGEAAEIIRRLSSIEREQMAMMRDEPMVWSRTHNRPSIRDALTIAGLIRRRADHSTAETWTEITELGRQVRAMLAKEA